MIKNPLDDKIPEEFGDQVIAYGRDLAYGAMNGLWKPTFSFAMKGVIHLYDPHPEAEAIFNEKWNTLGNLDVYTQLLVSLGYAEEVEHRFRLTQNAFSLLDKPLNPPSVFISYRRSESSAFALAVEARLKNAGVDNPFVDKNIVPGDKWNSLLEETVKDAEYFVCLVGPTTLDSVNVQEEIEWAERYGCRIISIWHNGVNSRDIADKIPQVFNDTHRIKVDVESALHYEIAISQLLNAMGYSTF